MAISICYGLLAATCLTLLYVPALYLIVRDVRNAVVVRFERKEGTKSMADDSGHIPGR
jgi:hypothetical protein